METDVTPLPYLSLIKRKWLVLASLGYILSLPVQAFSGINDSYSRKNHSDASSLRIPALTAPGDSCLPISTLPCEQVQVSMPVNLTFDSPVPNSLVDKNNVGTGFNMVDAYSGTRLSADGSPSNINVPAYEPAKLTITGGTLKLLTNKGFGYLTNNNQINALGVKVDSRGKLQIETTMVNPLNGTSGQQGGLWFGLNDKTFIKIMVSENKVNLRREVNDVSGTGSSDVLITSVITDLNKKTVRLRLIVDPVANTVEGFYSLDGTTYVNVAGTATTKTLSIAGLGLATGTAYAGVYATHRNSSTSTTYTFDDFAVTRINNVPVIVQAPVDQTLQPNQAFSFSAGNYKEVDAWDALTYSVTLADGSALPAWLKFDVATLTFSGTSPTTGENLAVKITATDQEQAAVSATIKVTALANTAPIMVQAPENRKLIAGKAFNFSGGSYSDADTWDALTYTVSLADGSALPGWLNFNASNQLFTGVAPVDATSLNVKVIVKDKAQAGVEAMFTIAVESAAPLLNLTFNGSVAGTLVDKNNIGTGFTMVDPYSGIRLSADGTPSNAGMPSYEVSKLNLLDGKLRLTTNKGFAYLTNNNQINALGVPVDGRGKLQIETILINPFYGTSGQQVGIWYGLNDKTFVKLMVSENKLSLRREINDVSGTGTSDVLITPAISGLSQQTVWLRLIVDPNANTVEGFYSTDGTNFTNVAATYATKTLSIAGMGLATDPVYTGIYATHRNSSTAVTYSFDQFTVTPIYANKVPVIANKASNYTLPEDAALGSAVGNVSATDPDGDLITYSIVSGSSNGIFVIDAVTGAVKLAKRLTYHTQSKYTLKVRATDTGGLSDEATLSIAVTPISAATFTNVLWSTVANQPYKVSESQGEAVNGKLYTFGGFDSQKSGFTPTSRAYAYDPVANTWAALAPMPAMNGTTFGGVTHAGFTNDGTDIYFAGGYTSNADGTGQIFGTKEVWKYIVSENRYERLPDLPITIAAGQLEYLNGRLHHIAGTNAARTTDLGNHYVLDLDNKAAGWKTLAALPNPRQHSGSAVFEGNIYYIGGQTGHDASLVARADVHRYDPVTNTWSEMADLPVPSNAIGRGHISSSVVVFGNRIIVLGGETVHDANLTNMVSAYTPATDTWENLTALPAARFSGVAAVLAGNLYYTGGGTGSSTSAITYRGQPTNSLSFSVESLTFNIVEGTEMPAQSVTLMANQGTPAITLSKTTADWLTLPTASLGALNFGPENISASLEPGTYQATITAVANEYASASLLIKVVVTADANKRRINFQAASSKTPSSYIADTGLPFDNVRRFGWIDPATKQPKSNESNMRERTNTTDELRLRTLGMMQINGTMGWEYSLPNGLYNVSVSAGDHGYYESVHQINVEGSPAIMNFVPSASQKYQAATITVEVQDRKLTVDPIGGTNSKINYIIITPATPGFDFTAPTAAIKFTGNPQATGIYKDQVLVTIDAADNGGSGLDTIQYSLNNGAYLKYSAPVLISEPGNYTFKARITDGNTNETITKTYSFSVVTAPAQSNAYMVLEHADKFPANDKLTFSLIQNPWRRTSPDTTAYNRNHNIVKLRIRNRGTEALIINKLGLSRPAAWKISELNGATYDSTAFPLTIAPGSSTLATIEFIAKDQATRTKLLRDTLYINSNDDLTPNKKVQLYGLWQIKGEDIYEPYAQDIINAFGFKTTVGFGQHDGASDGNGIIANSDEILSAFFVRADAAQPVRIIQMAAYHGCCGTTESIYWYSKGSTSLNTLFTHNKLDGQSLLPRLSGTSATGLAQGSFNPTAAFGLRVGPSSIAAYSDRTRNSQGKIGMRIWKARDADGNIIPNAYIIGADYLGTSYTNYDYQDNVYYVSNVRPETGPVNYSELAASPSANSFGTVAVGASKTITVPLKNMGQTYASGSDPSITIKRVEVVGQYLSDVSMFTVTNPATTTLAPQASTNVSVRFAPTSRGIKNAALLVYYNNATPLRIPLYGTADDANFTTKLVKRIKGGSDVNMTIAGQEWEADINYRQGNIKLDKQIIAGPIAATDADVLYQTYLSSAADLDEIRYAVTLPNGTYQVRLHLVENFWSAAGSRVFRITAENETRLNNFDIFREVGYRTALVKDYVVTVSDGVLSLKFNPTIDRLALAGVEIFQAQAKSATATAISSLEEAALRTEANATQLKLFPNPGRSGEPVQVQLSGFQSRETVTLRMQDLLGRVVVQQRVVIDKQGGAQVSLPIEGGSRGVYLLEAQGVRNRAQGKLLLE